MKTTFSISLLLLAFFAISPACGEEEASYNREADNHPFTVFLEESGWCWFQDPRVIVHDDTLFIGAVRGNAEGEAVVGIYDLEADAPLGRVVLHPSLDRNDHNSPVFHIRPDGSILALYARHNVESFHYARVSDPDNPLIWDEQKKFHRPSPNPNDCVTYMNLFALKDEKLLYNFYRSIQFNPTYVISKDHGLSWSEPVHFFQSEVPGRNRPYARYASDEKNTIHVCITDAHPRNFGNSLYYFAFRDGNYYKADGALIKELDAQGPLRPSEAETIYKGSMAGDKPEGHGSVPNAAWASSIVLDADGHPQIGYSVYLNNDDIRYRIASWDGSKWIDREVAYGGACLYTRESSYSGLITLDPVDPQVVFISTNVDPATGKPAGEKHEIYRATIHPADTVASIKWEPVTRNSPVTNIRPIIVRDGSRRIVLWNRGDYKTYVNYQLDCVGFIETACRSKDTEKLSDPPSCDRQTGN